LKPGALPAAFEKAKKLENWIDWMMTKRLVGFLLFTDIVFLVYWTAMLLDLAGLVSLPPSVMYKDYDDPRVIAWNWSFFPIDVLFSVTGIAAVHFSRRGNLMWRPLAILSLCLTFVAGFMAVAYWSLLAEFDPAWFLPNLGLAVWPWFFIGGLVTAEARDHRPPLRDDRFIPDDPLL
jgi:hypothetical protein